MFHIGGDSHIWPFFVLGACNIILPSPTFDPQATLETVQNESISDLQIVPTQLVALLNLPDIGNYRLESLKRIWYAASPMPTEVLKKGIEIFGQKFIQGYGQTESGPHTTVLPQSLHTLTDKESADINFDVLASCGQPCLGVHIRIVDENDNDLPVGQIGEIIVASDRLMQEFWQKPEDTLEALRDGWLRTGDMGYYDDKGFIYIADRKKDMIVTGGENVFPREVEEILYQHPAVNEAAVIGIPDPYWVEKVHALVVLNAGTDIDAEGLIDFIKQRIAGYKVPKGIEFVSSLPKSPQGKILKKEIRLKYKRTE
jgi:acyl-CoA synthetase (AMP-forming)/AMP-acid ligase II